MCREFLTFKLNSSYQILVRFIFVYKECLKPVFDYKITFLFFFLVMWIHKGYCEVKMLVWNNRIKAFWYAIYITKWNKSFSTQHAIFPTFCSAENTENNNCLFRILTKSVRINLTHKLNFSKFILIFIAFSLVWLVGFN